MTLLLLPSWQAAVVQTLPLLDAAPTMGKEGVHCAARVGLPTRWQALLGAGPGTAGRVGSPSNIEPRAAVL